MGGRVAPVGVGVPRSGRREEESIRGEEMGKLDKESNGEVEMRGGT